MQKKQNKNRSHDIPGGHFLCQCCGCQPIPYVSFAFSTEVSKLPSLMLALRKRDLCKSSVVMNCKLSMFELREVFLIMNYHENYHLCLLIMSLDECVLHRFYIK